MHTIYKALPPEEIERIIAYCKDHTIQKGGLFEIYPGAKDSEKMVIVNSSPKNEPLEQFRPLGTFYCNYLGPGIISLEEDDPHHDSVSSVQLHIQVIKQTIDLLIEQGYPGTKICFEDLQKK
ncbi:MAG: hypothetical protein H8E32_03660 [Nitrospinae bacterium]|nr:hypothetical protein [Nitrospinota bacterium]